MEVRISDDFPEDQRQMMVEGLKEKLAELGEPQRTWSKEKLEEYAKTKNVLDMFLPKEKAECPMCGGQGRKEDIERWGSCFNCPKNQ